MYGKIDVGLNAYSQIAESGYPSSSFTSHLGGYGSSSIGGYGSPGAGGAGGYNSYRFWMCAHDTFVGYLFEQNSNLKTWALYSLFSHSYFIL